MEKGDLQTRMCVSFSYDCEKEVVKRTGQLKNGLSPFISYDSVPKMCPPSILMTQPSKRYFAVSVGSHLVHLQQPGPPVYKIKIPFTSEF